MAELILETQALGYEYPRGRHVSGSAGNGRSFALDDVNLAIPRGARVGLLGANGAGKTTLLFHFNGLLRPTRGKVLLEGRPVGYGRKETLRWRQKVGLVFQDPDDQLFAPSVQQDISYGPLNLGLSEADVRRRVEQSMDAMGIHQLAELPLHMLSFGQRKRVAIAGVLAMRPEVLVLDEPAAGLDPLGVQRLLDSLQSLRAAGATIVISTHNVDLAYSWADEIIILDEGRVSARGHPTIAMRDPAEMRAAHLRVPWVLELGRRLLRDGGGPIDADALPRTFEQLIERLDLPGDDEAATR